ncbi:ATP-binding protein [Roseovarius sp. 2305UL8-3]|uniref:ATP-binding protein n=1 Tax=Roseovarius conchicola TaxID=3121636 RepID=UPI003528506C
MTGQDRQLSFQLETLGTPETVRDILGDLRARLQNIGLDEDRCGTVEIVMAEALNNIVEHAYAPQCEGPLCLSARLDRGHLVIRTRDRGHPLPGLTLPKRALPDATGPLDSLPEGGFGWSLIHDLTETAQYTRKASENRLTLTFAINPPVSA